jgi:hypothetical protein
MKKIFLLLLFFTFSLGLAGCDYLDQDLIDQLTDYANEYCDTNPDSEYCNLDFEAELEKAEVLFASYLADYSNSEYTDEQIAEMYLEGELPEWFAEERAADLENGTVLSLEKIDFRLDGGFDVSYNATTGEDIILRKRPGRLHLDAENETAKISWYDGIDNDCDDLCDELQDLDTTKVTMTSYLEDYSNAEISNDDFGKEYYGGRLPEVVASQRTQDLADGVTLTLLDVVESDNMYFDITFEVTLSSGDKVVRKRPGRVRYSESTILIFWDPDNQTCDVVDDDCN